jgi:protein gp37
VSEKTGIAWTDHTFNPWWGCVRVSPGCENCYAERDSKRYGFGLWGPTSPRRFFGDKHWNEPLKWDRAAEKEGVRRRVFCASMADVFEDRRDLDEQRARLWHLIERTGSLDWLLLTKRPENAARLAPAMWDAGWPSNVWAMVTAEDQQRADERIPLLLKIPARVRGVSYEPALGPVDFRPWLWRVGMHMDGTHDRERIDWIIVGGESGPAMAARPFDVAWARTTAANCRRAGVAVFVKQLGSHVAWDGVQGGGVPCWPRATGHYDTGRGYWRKHLVDRKGGDPAEWPEDLRVQEFPR